MTQQRISLCLFSVLLAAAGCGGGPGAAVDIDPDAPPVVADQQPRISNQTPVISGGLPASGPSAPGTSPPGGGGSCVELCNSLPDRGCEAPPEGCEQGCNPVSEPCGAQGIALAICALPIACPNEFDDLSSQEQSAIVALCPNQYANLVACIQS